MMQISANKLVYSVKTAGAGEALLLLHGFMGSTQTWSQQWDNFSEQYHTVAIDLPGHGKTETPENPERHNIALVAADIADILNQLGLGKAHLLGYSMGGRVALYFAAHYPERVQSLTLESVSPGLASEAERERRRASDEGLAQKIEQEGLAAFVEHWGNLSLFASQKNLSADVQASIRAGRLRNNPDALAASLRGLGTGSQPSLWGELQHVRIPTLLIVGTLDSKYVEIGKQMAEKLPQVQFEIVESAGHTVHLEQPERFTQLVSAHIDHYSVESVKKAAVKERKREA